MPKNAKQLPGSVTVRYDLYDLATAQHKAGLAGLLLQIESMNDRRARETALKAPPEVVAQGVASAEVLFTAESTQALFDDLYSAKIVEVAVPQKWAGKEPKAVRETEVRTNDGKTKIEKRFIYDVVQPNGPFLARYTDDGKEIWHKLWRDMLWAIPRGKPTTRGPFNARAEGKSAKDGANVWRDLLDLQKATSHGGMRSVEVAGAILLAAQAVSAESVRFEDRADHALLLHFWQLAARIFVPEQIDGEGNRKLVGYVLAIPEVSDLTEFNYCYKRALSELKPQPRGYRPAEAVISLAAEGPLAFMSQLDRLASAQVLGRRPPEYLSGVEFFYFVDRDAKGKKLRDPKIAAHGRIPAWDGLLTRYDGLMSKGGPKNPLMLAGRLRALLDDVPWFARLEDDLAERDWCWFVHSVKEGHRTPRGMISFASDARRRFEQPLQEENKGLPKNNLCNFT